MKRAVKTVGGEKSADRVIIPRILSGKSLPPASESHKARCKRYYREHREALLKYHREKKWWLTERWRDQHKLRMRKRRILLRLAESVNREQEVLELHWTKEVTMEHKMPKGWSPEMEMRFRKEKLHKESREKFIRRILRAAANGTGAVACHPEARVGA